MTSVPPTYEPCGQCGAPLGDNQRYCVVCGANRRHPEDPVARYLAAAGRRRTTVVPPRPPAQRGDGKWVAVALALLPVAAGIGVMVGNGDGSSSADEKLLAALRNRPAAVGTAAGATTTAATTSLPSDFGLDKGYVVELGTLPWDTTTADSAKKAEDAAKDKGAKGVGLINPDDFALTPSSDGDYLLYSGEFKSKGDAEKALKRLKKDFPDAKVVKVGESTSATSASTAGNGKLTTSDAVATQTHATEQQKAEGAQIVQEIQANKGKTYVEQQRKLPDTIVIP
ncbi:MAG: SPOR domain-containing protein [Solirubrobacteraceae bacterium]